MCVVCVYVSMVYLEKLPDPAKYTATTNLILMYLMLMYAPGYIFLISRKFSGVAGSSSLLTAAGDCASMHIVSITVVIMV